MHLPLVEKFAVFPEQLNGDKIVEHQQYSLKTIDKREKQD